MPPPYDMAELPVIVVSATVSRSVSASSQNPPAALTASLPAKVLDSTRPPMPGSVLESNTKPPPSSPATLPEMVVFLIRKSPSRSRR